ncbi:MAG: site-specific integrase [Bacteroidales bacterium]|nr:site-specific integrase [Bacteroidales bacterium]
MSKNFKVSFYLRSNHTTKEGKLPIMTRISLRGDRVTVGSTGCFTDPKLWNSGTSRVKGRSGDALATNTELDRIEADLNYIYRRNEFEDFLTVEFIKSEYLGKTADKSSFLGFFDEFLKKTEAEVGVSRTKASFTKYDVIRRRFADFIYLRYKRKDLHMGELSYMHVSEFEHYLITECKYKHNTAMRIMRNLKTVVLQAMKFGLITRDPYANYKVKMERTDRGFLTEEELEMMLSKPMPVERLEQVRDVFVFSCFTGLAYIDLFQLSKEHIVKIDGKMWIMKKRQKTDVISNIMLLDVPQRILKKYAKMMKDDPHGRLLPVNTNQKMNAYLKEIADICGIKKHLTCHLARHTFATLALSKGCSVESVSRMLGHTNIATTQIYARITSKKIENDMLGMADRLGDLNAAVI